MPRIRFIPLRNLLLLACWAGAGAALGGASAGVKSASPVTHSSQKQPEQALPPSSGEDADEMVVDDDGLELGNAMVIEGRVEKPQVQFPLLREPPPMRDIRFEQSFLQNILKLDRENIPDPQLAEKK
jgi:hypothetical protein